MSADRSDLSTGLEPTPSDPLRQELEEPGSTWTGFLYFELAKVWILLGLFILDSWIIVFWTELPGWEWALLPTLGAALYADFVVYRVLWYRPPDDDVYRFRPFQRTWIRPVRWGRWTPEAWRAKAGKDPYGNAPVGPDAREFL